VDKYLLTFYANNSHQQGPIYIDYVLPVPVETYADNVLKPLPIGLADEFVAQCAENFRNRQIIIWGGWRDLFSSLAKMHL
jgi:hypothetical protein